MATISGLSDIPSYVAQLIDLERSQGPEKMYKDDQQDLTLKSATLTDLRTNLGALNTQVQMFLQPGNLSPFQAKAVTASNTGVATATASAAATNGTHSLLVRQLAKQSTVVSNQLGKGDSSVAGAEGAGDKTFRITAGGVDTDVTVTVGAGDTNQTILANMAAAINASGAAVTASVVSDSDTTARLVLVSSKSGSANAIGLQDVSGTLLASTGTSSGTQSSGTSGGTLYTSVQLDAVFTLDGLNITRGSNTVSDVLSGVTISLLAPQASDALPVSLSVGPDQSAIQSKVQAFLDAYNTTIKFLTERTSVKVDASTSGSGSTDVQSVTRGSLSGDPTYLGLMMNLRSDVGGRITTGLAGGALALSEIGVTTAADGTLSITDSSKFNKALSEKPDGVTALFNSADGIASRVSARLANFVTTGGILDNSLKAVTARIGSLNDAIQAQEALLKIRQDQLTKQLDALAQVAAQVTLQQEIVTYVLSSGTF